MCFLDNNDHVSVTKTRFRDGRRGLWFDLVTDGLCFDLEKDGLRLDVERDELRFDIENDGL